MKIKVPMSSPDIDQSDIDAVVKVIKEGPLALGPQAAAFEKKMADYIGVKHALTVNSGTAALHLIVKAMGIGPGDEVIVPSFTFAASVNAILFEGATPVFADIEKETFTLDPKDIERKITAKTKAILPVDVFGHPVEWDAVLAIAKKHNLKIIDDSCEALGAKYRGKMVGSLGDAAAFAFYPNKQMTTGEGGMIVTNDDKIAQICESLRNQGRGSMGQWLVHERLGYNYRMDELSAALGVSQLTRIEEFLAKREKAAQLYHQAFKGVDWLKEQVVKPDVRMSWFVYVIRLADYLDRDEVIKGLAEHGIPARDYFSPLHTQPYLAEKFASVKGKLPVTDAVSQRTLALPFHNRISEKEIRMVADALKDVVHKLTSKKQAA